MPAKKGAKKKAELEKQLNQTKTSLAREKAKNKAIETLISAGWRPKE